MTDTLSTVDLLHAYVERLEARDWAGFADLLHEDVVYRLPQTGEVVRGRDAYLAWNAELPRGGASSSRRPTATTPVAPPGSTPSPGRARDGTRVRHRVRRAAHRDRDWWPTAYDPPPRHG